MGGITQTIFSIIGSLLYPIFSIFFYVIDVIQKIFYSFAGLGTVTFGGRNWGIGGTTVDNSGGGGDNQNGIIYYLFRTETARNILLSMVILGLFLLIIFTVLAFIKNMYAAKQKRWQEIISSSIKGLINFLFLPVCCLLGVIAGNVLLQALNGATASSSDVTIGRQLFVTSAYNGNVFRDQWDGDATDVANLQILYNNTFGTNIQLEAGRDGNYYAEYLDQVFKSEKGPEINSWWSVNAWYHLWNINYLMIAAGGVFLLFALIKISFGALKRLFMLVLLFVISPAVCSLYPLDDGSAVGKWRSKFIEQFFSVYGAVIGLNLFFDLVPLINSIQFGGWSDGLGLVPLLVTIAGLYMVSDFINLITSLIPGAGNAYNEGSSLAGNAKRRVLQGTKAAGKGIRKVEGAFARAVGAGSARKSYIDEHKGELPTSYTDASGRTRSLDKETGESKADFKARKNDTAYKNAKKSANDALKKQKEEAGSGFFGSIGGSIFQGVKDVGNTIMDKSGFGKLAKPGEGAIRAGYRTGKETAQGQQKTRAATNKIQNILKKERPEGLTDQEWSTSQMGEISKILSGTNGDTVLGVLKKNKDFKKFIEGSGSGINLATDSAADVGRKLKGRQDVLVTQEALGRATQAQIDFQDEVKKTIKKMLEGSKLDLDTVFKSFLEGKKLDTKDLDIPDFLAAVKVNDYMKNGIITNKDGTTTSVAERRDKLNADVQTATVRAQKVAEDNRENGDAEFTKTMDNYLSYLQQTLNSLKDNKAIREMDSHLTEQFKQLLQKQTELIKQVKETSKNEQETMKKSLNDAAKKASEGKKG